VPAHSGSPRQNSEGRKTVVCLCVYVRMHVCVRACVHACMHVRTLVIWLQLILCLHLRIHNMYLLYYFVICNNIRDVQIVDSAVHMVMNVDACWCIYIGTQLFWLQVAAVVRSHNILTSHL